MSTSLTQTSTKIKPSEVWPELQSRLDSGSPFSTGAAAWQSSEVVASIEGATLSLSYTSHDHLLRIRATTQTEFLGSVQIAKRLGRGNYEALVNQQDFNYWLNETVAGHKVMLPQQASLLDLALAEFAKRSQWNSVATITIWQNYDKAAWLSRDSNGYICLQLFKDSARLTNRRYSKLLVIGFWSPGDAMFIESHSVRDDYQAWSTEARRMVA